MRRHPYDHAMGTLCTNGLAPIRREQLGAFDRLRECAVSIRDHQQRLICCNRAYEQMVSGVARGRDLNGTGLGDLVSAESADERAVIQRRVMASGVAEWHYQLAVDRRLLSSIIPLDADSFGHMGTIAISEPAAAERSWLKEVQPVPTLRTPALLDMLLPLTRREMEILHGAACGMSASQVAKSLHRAQKTVEHHIASIHRKLGVRTKGNLVRFCVERGLHAFSEEAWRTIVEQMFGGARHDAD